MGKGTGSNATVTVKYLAQHYTSTDNTYYYRQQLLTGDGKPYWGKMREVAESTYAKAKRAGHVCEWVEIRRPLADIVDFAELLRYKMLRQEWRNTEGML